MEQERRAGSSQILEMLETIHSLQLQQVRDNGEIRGSLGIHTEQIEGITKAQDRQWYMQFLGPIMVLVHAGIRKLGVNL